MVNVLLIISELWVQWQAEEITGDEFAKKVGRLIPDEVADSWTNYNRRIILRSGCLENPCEVLTLSFK